MALPLSACGGPSGPVSNVPSDTVRVAYSRLLPALDPHAWSDATGPRTLAPMFDALTFIQNDGKLRPSLAIAWSQVDPVTWQFRLRVDDAKFHNGELFGPDSVQVTLGRLRDSHVPLSKLASAVERVDTLDPATVNLITKEPESSVPRWLSAIYMLPARYFAQVGESGFVAQPVGTGYWRVDDFKPGSHLHLAQFRDSWRGARGGDSAPVLKRLELDIHSDPNGRADALRALEVDIATELTADQADGLQAAGFVPQTTSLSQLKDDDQGWQMAAFGELLGPATDVLAAGANVKSVATLPDGAWWFDRVTKTEMQRIAVAGGA